MLFGTMALHNETCKFAVDIAVLSLDALRSIIHCAKLDHCAHVHHDDLIGPEPLLYHICLQDEDILILFIDL